MLTTVLLFLVFRQDGNPAHEDPPAETKQEAPAPEDGTPEFHLESDGTLLLNKDNLSLYEDVAEGDPAWFAIHTDNALRAELDTYEDKDYQKEKFFKRLRSDEAILARFAKYKKALKGVTTIWPYTASVSYTGKRFTMEMGSNADGALDACERLNMGRLVDGPTYQGLTVGNWKRIKCSRSSVGDATLSGCEVELKGLPEDLKGRIETDVNKTVHARWRWKGLPALLKKKCEVASLGAIFETSFLIPQDATFEFVDDSNTSLWSLK